jgi:hypothetical protein
MMSTPFITYYEALAKLSQIANKQTMFLGHLLHEAVYEKELRQFLIDLSTYKKVQIMKKISPDVAEKSMANLANQYLSKLQKTEIIRNLGRGLWAVNPACYGQFRMISKDLRHKNEKIFLGMTFGPDGLEYVNVGGADENMEVPKPISIEELETRVS